MTTGRRRWRAARIGRAASAGTLTLACNAVLGVSELSQSDGGADSTTEVRYTEADCETCVATSCPDEAQSCRSACHELRRCHAACGRFDWSCRAGCEADHAEVARSEEWLALDACMRRACIDECYGAGGLVDFGLDTCPACFDLACESEQRACLQSEAGDTAAVGDCEREWWCLLDDPTIDPAKRLECTGGYPDRDDPRSELHACRDVGCVYLCDFGANWSCLLDYRWPAPTEETTRYDLSFVDASEALVPEVGVAACRAEDCATCTAQQQVSEAALAAGETTASLELPTTGNGFEGCFRIDPPAASNLNPTLHYFGRPIAAHEGTVPVRVPPSHAGLEPLLRLSLSPDRGHIWVTAHDCLGDRARGVRFEIDPPVGSSIAFYQQGSWFPELIAGPTNVDGSGGFFDVPPGRYEVRALVGTANTPGGGINAPTEVSSITVDVRAGWVTQAWLYPKAIR